MLAAKAPHPNCAYMWMQYISTPKVQAQQAVYYGETPVNSKACPYMNKLQAGSCAEYHANAPASYLESDQPLEDAARDLRQRPEQLRAYDDWVSRLEHADEVGSEPMTPQREPGQATARRALGRRMAAAACPPPSGAARGRGPACCSPLRWPGSC